MGHWSLQGCNLSGLSDVRIWFHSMEPENTPKWKRRDIYQTHQFVGFKKPFVEFGGFFKPYITDLVPFNLKDSGDGSSKWRCQKNQRFFLGCFFLAFSWSFHVSKTPAAREYIPHRKRTASFPLKMDGCGRPRNPFGGPRPIFQRRSCCYFQGVYTPEN